LDVVQIASLRAQLPRSGIGENGWGLPVDRAVPRRCSDVDVLAAQVAVRS